VRVDTTRHDELTAGIDDLAARGRRNTWCDLYDLSIHAQDVRLVGLIGRNDRAAFDEYRHFDHLYMSSRNGRRSYAWVEADWATADFCMLRRLLK
jgi:hypothetical protein